MKVETWEFALGEGANDPLGPKPSVPSSDDKVNCSIHSD